MLMAYSAHRKVDNSKQQVVGKQLQRQVKVFKLWQYWWEIYQHTIYNVSSATNFLWASWICIHPPLHSNLETLLFLLQFPVGNLPTLSEVGRAQQEASAKGEDILYSCLPCLDCRVQNLNHHTGYGSHLVSC